MNNDVKVIKDGESTQIEIQMGSTTKFDADTMDVHAFMNFDAMRDSLSYEKDKFTVHPYPKDDFSPVSMLDTLSMWKIETHYHCHGGEDYECLIQVYQAAMDKINEVMKEELGRKWGLYLMPDGYNLAIVHNHDILMKEMNKLMLKEQKKSHAADKRKKVSAKALAILTKKGK